MAVLIASALFFVVLHLGVAGTRWRHAVVARLGASGCSPAFSAASLAGLWCLVNSYTAAPCLETWGPLEAGSPSPWS